MLQEEIEPLEDALKKVFGTLIVALLIVIAIQQHSIIGNQHVQLRQQFHSDFISLVALMGDEGIRKLFASNDQKELSFTESYATGLLIQRFIVAKSIRHAYTAAEWNAIHRDMKAAMGLPMLRARWRAVRGWYAEDTQRFIDSLTKEDK